MPELSAAPAVPCKRCASGLFCAAQSWCILASLGLAFLLGGCWEGVTREVQAVALDTSARVSHQSAEADQPLKTGAVVSAGDIVRTAPGAAATLALLPNVIVEIGENSVAELLDLQIRKDGNETDDPILERSARIGLLRGTATVWQEWGGEPVSTVAVEGPGDAAATGSYASLFRVEVTSAGLQVLSGTGVVNVRAGKDPGGKDLEPGTGAELRGGAIETFDIADRGVTQQQLPALLNAPARLRPLRDAGRNVLPQRAKD